MKEAATITAFQNSHWTIREAARLCMPWNASFAAIEGFLISNKWMEKDVGTGQQATKLLSDFTDHVFSLNAGRWRSKRGFLYFIELGSVWTSWFTRRGGVVTLSRSKPQSSEVSSIRQQAAAKKKGQSGGQQQQKAKPATHRSAAAAAPNNICKRWNLNKCPNAASDICCTSAGLVLRHICNFYKTDGLETRCKAAHMRINH
jgi:hypothetical protein